MTTSPSPASISPSPSHGAFPSSLPRWRQFLSTLNWRRDPGYEQRIWQYEQRRIHYEQSEIEHEQRMMRHEQRMKQLENEIQQLDRENARLENLLSCVDRLCFPPESSSTPPPAIESDCEPSAVDGGAGMGGGGRILMRRCLRRSCDLPAAFLTIQSCLLSLDALTGADAPPSPAPSPSAP